jgi:hypothetical protein
MMCTSRPRKQEHLASLCQPIIGESIHSVWQHQSNNLANNNKRFSEPWDGAEPFENVCERFEDCIEFSWAALSPYSDTQIMNWATLVVYNTGLFYEELKKWDARPAAHKSFEEFCDHIQ